MAEDAHLPHVVIVGAGFGGLAAAQRLEGEAVRVTLVDRHNFHTFLPLIYQVATAGLNAADVAYPVRGLFQRAQHVAFRQATVTGVDWERRVVLLADGETGDGPSREGSGGVGSELAFDHLIVSGGSRPAFFGVPGAEEHGFPLYSLTDATRLRNHVLSCFERADAHPELVDDGGLTFVVVGGGPTGVEVAGALAELVEQVLVKDFHTLDAQRARIVLVEASDRLLAPFDARAQRYARRVLSWRGVEVRVSTSVAEVGPDRVRLADGTTIPTRTLIWAAGVRAGALADVLGVETGRGGRVVVGPDLAIPGAPGAYAVGDIADIVDVDDAGGAHLPQLAQVALQGGTHAAEQVLATLAGRSTTAFHYRDKGTMATIGRRAAVAQLPVGPVLTGVVAWLAWLGLHLVYLMGMRNRVSVLVNWAWNYLTWDRGPRLIFGGADGPDPDPLGVLDPPPPPPPPPPDHPVL